MQRELFSCSFFILLRFVLEIISWKVNLVNLKQMSHLFYHRCDISILFSYFSAGVTHFFSWNRKQQRSIHIRRCIQIDIFFFLVCFSVCNEMIDTTNDRQNNIENREEKNTKHSCSSALNYTGNPNERKRKGSNGKNTVNHNVCHIRTNQREHKEQITKRNQCPERSRWPNQNKINGRTFQQIGNHSEKNHNDHKIYTHMTEIRFQNRTKFFHIVFYSFFFKFFRIKKSVMKNKKTDLISKSPFQFCKF